VTSEQFLRVGELYHAAMDLAPEARLDFLANACAGEDELRREVESLLQAHEQADGFIAGKVAGVVAEMPAQQQNPSLIGHNISHYQVLSLLGAGGMGEVYLAQDARLRRKVALKLLPRIYAHNQEWLRRFQREALATSSLNHPNILTVYDIGTTSTELGGAPFIVAELLEGEELRKQMKEGPLPVRKAIEYARQIAAGLAAAHEKGIVHRDLKPENLFVTKDGLVKILDFGLAKLSPQRSEPNGAGTTLITNPGTVMGTVGYMSPEQVRGQEADHHSDIFSFGLILYEMLAGRRAFQGESAAETMAAIVNQEPPEISEINSKIPPQLERIVGHCLEKQPARRFQNASDLGFALEALLTPSGSRLKEVTASSATEIINILPRRVGREKWWIAATALALVVAAGFAWAYFIRPSVPDARQMKLSLVLPEKTKFRHLTVSPDGAWLALNVETGSTFQLWTLELATGEARPLEGSEGARYPFWSPDSRFIGFFTLDKLKKIEVNGGLPVTLCDYRGGIGGSWSREGVIILSATGGADLSRVSATGGPVTPVLTPDLRRQESEVQTPSFLPDGRHFLYSVLSSNDGVRGIYLGSLDGGVQQRLLGDASNAIYAAFGTEGVGPGYLLFGRERALMAQLFDARTLRLGGEPFPVAGQVATIIGTINRRFSASNTGVLVFDPAPDRQRQHAIWVDRSGKTINSLVRLDNVRLTRLAPDGRRFVVSCYDPQTNNLDLWLSDVTSGNAVRFTFDPAADQYGVWSPDASRIAWAAKRGQYFQLYEKAVSRAGHETPLFQSDYHKFPTDWSRDGRFIIYRQVDPKTKNDIWVLPLFGEQKPFPLLQTEANEGAGSLSPDGQWLAYQSDESDRYEVYVQRFLDGGDKQRVSTGGGSCPYWRGDGKELYYHAPDGKVMAAAVMGEESLAVGAPVALFEFRSGRLLDQPYYSVDRDGQRFLLNTIVESETNSPLTVIVNWMAAMKK
jgi:serine/threonine protein kinase/Tol biopolymer transport system component